jgi:hypothetical protein
MAASAARRPKAKVKAAKRGRSLVRKTRPMKAPKKP